MNFAWHIGARRFFFFFCSYMFSFYCCCCGVRSRDAMMERNQTRAFLRLVLNFSWGSRKSGRSNEQKQTRIDEWHYTQFLFLFPFLPLSLSLSPAVTTTTQKTCIFICSVQMEDKSHEDITFSFILGPNVPRVFLLPCFTFTSSTAPDESTQ